MLLRGGIPWGGGAMHPGSWDIYIYICVFFLTLFGVWDLLDGPPGAPTIEKSTFWVWDLLDGPPGAQTIEKSTFWGLGPPKSGPPKVLRGPPKVSSLAPGILFLFRIFDI